MLRPGDVGVESRSPEELQWLVGELLGEMTRLRDENAALREEIARLMGHKCRPKIKPSGMERATPERARRAKTKRSKRSTIAERVVHEERVLAISAPPGLRYKDYEDFDRPEIPLHASGSENDIHNPRPALRLPLAQLSTVGRTSATPVSRSGQTAPNRCTAVWRRSRLPRGRKPRAYQRWPTRPVWSTPASSRNQTSTSRPGG